MPRVQKSFMTAMDTLVLVAEEVGWIFSRRGSLSGIGHTSQTWKALQAERSDWAKKRENRERLTYLRKQRIMDSRCVGERLEVKLTNKGSCYLLKALIKQAPELASGLICIIVFDIPESERAMRLMFRRYLKCCGFKQMQKSVWFTNRAAGDLLRALVKQQKLEAWIQVIEGRVL